MDTEKRKEINDAELARLLKLSALTAPPSPWFTRKVMNRLPERKVRVVALAEYAVYVLAALVTAVMGYFYTRDVLAGGVITVGNIVMFSAFVGLIIAIGWLFVSPWIASLRE